MKEITCMNKPVIETKKTRKQFDKTFKQHAVELWLNSGKAATAVAAELGIHPSGSGPGGSASRRRPRGDGAAARSAAPNNWKLKILASGGRTIISANSGTF